MRYLLTALLLLLIESAALGSQGRLSGPDLYRRVGPSVLALRVKKQESQVGGSAYIVGPDTAVTAWHVIDGATSVSAYFSDYEPCPVIGLVASDPEHDLALIRIKAKGRKPIKLAEASPKIGARAYVVGSPSGLVSSFSDGIVSQIRYQGNVKLLQFTCPVSPGSSGGPLLDENGAVIGTVSRQYIDGQNLNFAVAAGYVRSLRASKNVLSWSGSNVLGHKDFHKRDKSDLIVASDRGLSVKEIPLKNLAKRYVNDLAVSPSGQRIAAIVDDVRLVCWRSDQPAQPISTVLDAEVTYLTFSHDESLLAVGLTDGSVLLLAPETLTEVRRLTVGFPPSRLRFTPDHRVILAVDVRDDGGSDTYFYSTADGAFFRKLPKFGAFASVVLSADNRQVLGLKPVGEHGEQLVSVRDLKKGWETKTVTAITADDDEPYVVSALAAHPDGKTLVVGLTSLDKDSRTCLIRMINVQTGLPSRTLPRIKGYAMEVQITDDGGMILLNTGRSIVLWDTVSADTVAGLMSDSDPLAQMSSDGKILAYTTGTRIRAYTISRPPELAGRSYKVDVAPTKVDELDSEGKGRGGNSSEGDARHAKNTVLGGALSNRTASDKPAASRGPSGDRWLVESGSLGVSDSPKFVRSRRGPGANDRRR